MTQTNHALSTDAKPVTMACAREWLKAAPLNAVQKRDMGSSIDAVCRWARKPAEQIFLHPVALRNLFKTISPGGMGITRKRIANIKSGLGRLMRLMGIASGSVADGALSEEWATETARIGNKYARLALVRLGRYCTSRGVPPSAVCDHVVDDFKLHLEMRFRVGDPRKTHRETTRSWN